MRVFGIGLNKTGTKTLGQCLKILGYNHTSFDFSLLKDVSQGSYDRLYQVVESFESFEDWPYPLLFENLDHRYPDSKFILTRRSCPNKWLESLTAHSLRTDPEIGPITRNIVYGFPYPQVNPAAHLRIYEDHLERVRHYFQDRPQDLLEICWEDDSSWSRLCHFLDMPIPSFPFPHENRAVLGKRYRIEMNQNQLSRFCQNIQGSV